MPEVVLELVDTDEGLNRLLAVGVWVGHRGEGGAHPERNRWVMLDRDSPAD